MKEIELVFNIVHYFVYRADYRAHLFFKRINPIMLIHKLPFQKRLYERKGIDIYEEMNSSFKDPKYGLSSMRAGGFMFILSLLFSLFIFCLLVSLNKDYLPGFVIFLVAFPFALLTYYLLFYKDKYLGYFKVFEAKPPKWKKKWGWVSFGIVLAIIALLILGGIIMTYSLHH